MDGKKVKLVCNKCKSDFYLLAEDIKTSGVDVGGNTVDVQYFVCPRCNTVYVIAIIDQVVKKLSEEINELQTILQNGGSNNSANIMYQAYVRKCAEMKKYRIVLAKKYTGYFTFKKSVVGNSMKEYLIYIP